MMGRPIRAIRPALTLREVFGPAPVFNPRASFSHYGWLPRDAPALDRMTGGMLAAAGGMPTICSTSVVTATALELLAEAGLPPVDAVLTYADEAEYHQQIAAVVAGSRPIVVQHVHRVEEIPASSHYVPRRVLAFLNNKAHLEDLVPDGAVPSRRLMRPAQLVDLAVGSRWRPVVIKAATDRSSGGGHAVVLARSPDDAGRAARKFAACRRVIVEEFLDFQRTFCLNFVLTWDETIVYLGAGEQVVTDSGEYRGNWFARDRQPPVEAVEIGHEIMRRAAWRGYCGFAGFDVGVTPDGRVKVFDLNFRINGSTKALLFLRGVQEAFAESAVGLLTTLRCRRPFVHARDVTREALHRGIFVPLATYDPPPIPGTSDASAVSGLVLGDSRQHVLANLAYLASRGLADELLESPDASVPHRHELRRDRRAA